MSDALGFFDDGTGRYHEAVEELYRREARKRKARQKQAQEYAARLHAENDPEPTPERKPETNDRPAARTVQPARRTPTIGRR